MYQTHRPILDALRARGVSTALLTRAVDTATDGGRPLRDVLIADGLVTEVELAEALAQAYGLVYADLDSFPVDPAATAAIPVALAKRHRVWASPWTTGRSWWPSPTPATSWPWTTSGPRPDCGCGRSSSPATS